MMTTDYHEGVAVPDASFTTLEELPTDTPRSTTVSHRKKRVLAAGAGLLAAIFVVAWVATAPADNSHAPTYSATLGSSADDVKNDADDARKQFEAEMDKLTPYLSTIYTAGGLLICLFGRRLIDPTIFVGSGLSAGFLVNSLLSSVLADWTGMSAHNKCYLVVAVAAVAGLVAGYLLVKLRKLGVAVLAGAGAFVGGQLLYSLTLDTVISAYWGQYVVAGVIALIAALVTYRYEDGLLVYITAASGAFVATYGGAALFFDYTPTSVDAQAHWGSWSKAKEDAHQIYAGKDKNFWFFVASFVALFIVGLVAQFKMCPDPEIERQRRLREQREQENGFYPANREPVAFVPIDDNII